MRFASFLRDDRPGYGVVVEGGIVDLTPRIGDRYPTLLSLIAGDEALAIGRRHAGDRADVKVSDVVLLPPIPQPGKLLCFGGAFPTHIAEIGRPPPKYPGFHVRSASSLVGGDVPLVLPRVSKDLDYECELAIVIGKAGRDIARADALDHIFGYACFNDGSVRDFQIEHGTSNGKNFDASGSFGPWIVTADELPDLAPLTISTRLNGTVLQEAKLGEMLLTPADFIAYLSIIMRLEPGDVLTSGCPGGVGYFRNPRLYMKAGDTVEFSVDGIGALRHTIVDQA